MNVFVVWEKAMERKPKEADLSEVMPILAATALGNATGGDDRIKSLLIELIEDQMEKRRKEKDKSKRLAESAVQAAKEEKEMRESQQRRCNHRKQDGYTRLVGQRVTGTGQISLVCQFCNKNFFMPPFNGQIAPPQDLIPNGDEIGG